ncbi:MAG: hypothetical protein CVV30_05695 [Methanomicrobiales archaeon HGW-Methanomicrobiales-1]|jgi:hypothetical protein|nr:MAG: hypothetical protein CVV30_05695 [Methanomicrobiales archaeon HGW-Methanomicrobiales-1]
MSEKEAGIPYSRLVAIADHLLESADDDVALLARGIDALEQPVRDELLVSDQLNAYQVFYYFFRFEPDILVQERLDLEPASALRGGLMIEDTDLLEMFFGIRDAKPIIVISDGDKTVATFTGKSAYEQGRVFLASPEYR